MTTAQLRAENSSLRAQNKTLRFLLDELRAGIKATQASRLRNERVIRSRKIYKGEQLCLD